MKTKIKYYLSIGIAVWMILFVRTAHGTVKNVPFNYPTIQGALNSCSANDTVLVAPGTYYEHINWPNIPNLKLLSSGDSSNTIINGSGSGRPLYFYHVVDSMGTNTIIRGFKIENGYIQSSSAYGGGILVAGCSPNFENINVSNNHLSSSDWGYGAGVYLKNSNSSIRNSSLTYNIIDTATWSFGAGIYCDGGAPTFDNILVSNNFSHSDSWVYGVGMYISECNSTITNSKIVYNQSGNNASWYTGGGVYITDGGSTITNSEIMYNTSGNNGDWYRGALSLENCNVNLVNVKVHGNKLGNNGTYYFSAGINIEGANANLNNALVDSNVNGAGGSYYFGLGLYIERSISWYPANTVNIVHTTVTNNINVASNNIPGKSIFKDCYSNDCDSLVINIKNSILYNNTNGNEISAGNLITVTYSDVKGNTVYPGIGNINSNPNFVSVSNPHLTTSSPCSNAGLVLSFPTFDLENSSRPYPAGSNPDMGCYEIALSYTYVNMSHTMCQGDTFMNYYTSGVYLDTIHTSTGYDTIKTLNLTVLPTSTSNVSQTICQGSSYFGYTTTGTYVDTLLAINGCDSIRILNLTVLPTSTSNVAQTICQGSSYFGYTITGTYVDTLITVNGCDSIRTLNLTVLPTSTSNVSQTICQGSSYFGYTITGTYVDTLLAVNGCDSIRTLNLTVLPTSTSNVSQTICQGSSYFGYSTTGTYVDTLLAVNGCDSIRTLNLTVLPANNPNCWPVGVVGLEDEKDFKIYPNPTTGIITLQYNCQSPSVFILRNLVGQEVFRIALPSSKIMNTSFTLPNHLTNGVYNYTCSFSSGYTNKMGKINILR